MCIRDSSNAGSEADVGGLQAVELDNDITVIDGSLARGVGDDDAAIGLALSLSLIHIYIHKEYIGVDACACNLMRPAMYGAYHHITVAGKEDAPCDHLYDVTGGLCENNDKFAVDRWLPAICPGDIPVSYTHLTGCASRGPRRS